MGYLIKGQILMDGEDYLSASRILGKAYATNKDSVTLSRYYTALAQAGEVGKAEKLMAGWLADHPDDNVARLAWADEASRAGNTARAVKQYERIALSEPNNVPVLVRLASSYQEMGDRRDLKTAQKAYELDSEDVYAKHLYGWLLVQTGLVERGTELLQDAVARAPNNATFRIHLASALAESGFEEDARITLQPLLNTDIKLADFSGAPALLEQLGIQPQ
jgi:Flp pilus assembly protein TadD